MLIRWKILIAVAALYAAVSAAQYLVQRAVIEPSFAALEHNAAVTDMDRVEAGIAPDLDHLQTMSVNWGDWDETYHFMEDRHEEFIARNITNEAVKKLRVDAIAFVDLTLVLLLLLYGRSVLELTFADNGAGISPETLKKIFVNRFSSKSKVTDAGIGLHWWRLHSMPSRHVHDCNPP